MIHNINFFDRNTVDMPYCNMFWPAPEHVNYIKPGLLDFDGITVFTDELCFDPIVDQVKGKWKIAWGLESPCIKPNLHLNAKHIEHKFDYIYTCNPLIGNGNPKYKQSYWGCCWIPDGWHKIYSKYKLLSTVVSNKHYAQGHKLRHEVVGANLHPQLEVWGSPLFQHYGNEPLERLKPHAPYRYSIVIENCQYPGFFSEKIIDCFATGTIPIYWGDPNIKNIFDPQGMYTWNTIPELHNILQRISESDYNSRLPAIEANYKLFPEFASPDRWMAKNCYDWLNTL